MLRFRSQGQEGEPTEDTQERQALKQGKQQGSGSGEGMEESLGNHDAE